MSLPRRNFLRALICAPFAAKAVERIIAQGVTPPKVEPVKPTVEPVWARAARDEMMLYSCTGYVGLGWGQNGPNHPYAASGTFRYIVSG